MNTNTQPGELFTPAERAAGEASGEAYIFQRLGAPQEVIAATRAHLNNMEVAEAANRQLHQANPGLFEAWDELHPLDLVTTTREELDGFIASAKDEPSAAYMVGFVQALILMRTELSLATGRSIDD